jgi:hypothetical protein
VTIKDISEDIPYNISTAAVEEGFTLEDVAYDLTIDDIPFILSVSKDTPYMRETAQYKRDQLDVSVEPGEQSLSGWWLRSQTSWHNGAGITFYEPGVDYEHVSHRFADSRGVDIWTIGQATVLPEVFHAYTGAGEINAAVGSDGTDVLISGDKNGILKKVALNGNSSATTTNYVDGATSYPAGHNGSNYPFKSVTTDGSYYYAACTRCVHSGPIATANADRIEYVFSTTSKDNVFIKYVKGYLLLGVDNTLTNLHNSTSTLTSSSGHATGSADIPTAGYQKKHLNASWSWNDATSGPGYVYVSGYAGNKSEIWAIGFDDTANTLDMAGAVVVGELPTGEIVNAIHYYIGYLAIGTSKGVRIAQIQTNGALTIGPLLVENNYAVKGFVESGNYIYAATKADNETATYTHGILIRIDLSTPFNDGTFPYAYDLEYRSSVNIDNEGGWSANSSECTEVYALNDRLVMVIEEGISGNTGELQVQHTTRKRDTAWLQTGKIRYATVEPKFFRYINLQCSTGQSDTIEIKLIDKNDVETGFVTVTSGISNQDIFISSLTDSVEVLGFKFVFNNSSIDNNLPILQSYQIKATPGTRRQRLIQYPLSCYDTEMDRYNTVFGYTNRAVEILNRLEALEKSSKFVTVTDYRMGETYSGLIEEVRFRNESSPDKRNPGFGGLLLVTVRMI